MHERSFGRYLRAPQPLVLVALTVCLAFCSTAAFASLIDFEQWPYSPAPSDCSEAPYRGSIVAQDATFTSGQLATGVGAIDKSTVYWNKYDCPGAISRRMDIRFASPVSNLTFYLENLEADQASTFFQLLMFNELNQRFSEGVWLGAPNARFHSSTLIQIPSYYGRISRVVIGAVGTEYNFLIDNIRYNLFLASRPLANIQALLAQWNRLGCATSARPACQAIQANLIRMGYIFPTPTPSCGLSGQPCCDPASGMPSCSADSTCDSTAGSPTFGTCVPSCGLPGEPCCDAASGAQPCDAGSSCEPATGTCVPGCGSLGGACCDTASGAQPCNTPDLTCSPAGTCVPTCGAPGGPCCDPASGVPPCSTGNTCDSTDTCIPSCGLPGQACCVSPAGVPSCNPGSTCNPTNNTCQ